MLFIIRHGQTEMNNAKVLQGRTDLPLNAKGMEQAEEAGKWFREKGISFDRIYSSPLIRAVQTALLATGVTIEDMDRMLSKEKSEWPDHVQIDERLIEMDYGPYEGMGLKNPPPEIIAFFSDFQNTPAPDGMEPLEKVVERSGDFLEEIRAEAAQKNILISTHAIAMKGLLEYLTPESNGAYWSKYVGNCDVYTAEVTAKGYTVPKELEGPGASAREVGC